MKNLYFAFVAAFALFLVSCDKNELSPTSAQATLSNAQTADSSAIQSLPAAIKTYITTNYPTAVIKEAAKDKLGNYLVKIVAGTTTTILTFDAAGVFKSATNLVLPTVPDNKSKLDSAKNKLDSTIKASINTYIAANYAGATIKNITRDKSGNFLVLIMQTNTLTVLTFDSKGAFVSATTVTGQVNKPTKADSTTLAAINTYITTNYTGAVVKGIIKGRTGNYVVNISVNNIITILTFDAKGAFLSATTVTGQTPKPSKLDSTVLASINTYIADNYAGAIIKDIEKDKLGNYMVQIVVNKVIGIVSFDSTGKFISITMPDTSAVSAVITAINTYISTNYAGASIREVKRDKSGNYLVTIKFNGANKLLTFDSTGKFVK